MATKETKGNKDITEREKIWHGIAAASLSVVAGLGHLYLGIPRGNILIACSAAFFLIGRFYWPPAEWLYIQFAIFSGVDAFSFAKRGRGLF